MKHFMRLVVVNIILFAGLSCTIHLNPHEFESQKIVAPALQNIKPVAIRARLTYTKEKELPLAGTSVFVNEDEFAEVLVERLRNALKNQGIPVALEAGRVIEIQIVQVAMQPTARIYCVIDFNRKLDGGEFYGFQSRSSGSPESACNEALNNAVSEILNDQDTMNYLKGD